MQRLTHLYTRTCRVAGVNYLNTIKLYKNDNSLYNTNHILFKRCLATKHKNSDKIDVHSDLFKPSTAKEKTHIADELKGVQPIQTITDAANKPPVVDGGKIWTTHNPNEVHVPEAGNIVSSTPRSTQAGDQPHETTVYATKGQINLADPLKTRTIQATPPPTPAQLAEAAAASAFEPFAPETPVIKTSQTDTVFTPKISSTDTYSTTTSPTAEFDTSISSAASQQQQQQQPQKEPIVYHTTKKSKVFGGVDTSADTKSHPKENPFDLKEPNEPSSVFDQTTNEDENSIRNNILRESLNYVHDKGWSMDAIRAGISACKQPTTSEALFYNGYDLVEYFMRDANAKTVEYLHQLANKENIQGTQLLIHGLKYRLKIVIPYAETWEEALAQKGLPTNAKRAWKSLLDFANDIWLSVGDSSTDMKWYTKRISVATIYRSAEIYMLRDKSPEKIETMKFLERHLSDYQATGSVTRSVTQSLSDTAQVASGLFTVVRSMRTRR